MVARPTPPADRPLHDVFTAVPPRYDLINRLFTLGQDRRWRRLAARCCLEGHPSHLLDIGCGTGDLSIELARLASEGTRIDALDFSAPMLERARQKARQAGVSERITFIEGDATALPFPDRSLDVACIAFAFRNLVYRNPGRTRHLAEVFRVLEPGGRYVIVESSQPSNLVVRGICHLYESAFVGPVGGVLSGQPAAYRYLAESSRDFHSPREIEQMLRAAGFARVRYRPLLLGAAGLHVAET
ncbi:MAG: ubiquinone/menaquinone biosynthesis methyltransferase [Deltaproteobacteria bacterium]|nr:ubiquinone/menaquinone biosynthesis methyltransferase [Deltaproteobacteria bacterium]